MATKKIVKKTPIKKTRVTAPKAVVKRDVIGSFKSSFSEKTRKLSRKQIWIVAGIVVILVALYFGRGLFIAATVDGQPISRVSVIQELESQGGQSALDSLIARKLILNEAKKQNVTVDQSDVDNQIKTIQTQIESQGSTLDQELAAQGMTRVSFSDQLKLQLLLDKMVGKDAITDKEISDYVAANPDQFPQGVDATISAQIKEQLTAQNLQQKEQDFVQSLRTKAKIIYLVNY